MDWWRDEGPESGESEVSMVELTVRLFTVRLGPGEDWLGLRLLAVRLGPGEDWLALAG